jgi:ABC-type antimicrobial peptide transport system permease subunit
VVKTAQEPAAAWTSDVTAAVKSVDSDLPVADVATMANRVARDSGRAKTSLMLALTLAGLAISLAVVGVYGVLSFGVAQRQREFGIRLAIGATPRGIARLIVREGLLLTAVGVAAGIIGASFVARSAKEFLYVTTPGEMTSYVIGSAIVIVCSAGALWLPAWRASRANPGIALRGE